jgi:putative ABC transport system permease protein
VPNTMNVAEAVFRAFVGTCPREFRRNYGAQTVETFRETAKRRSAEGGAQAAWTFVMSAYADILWTAFREHTAMVGKDVAYALRLIEKSWGSSVIVICTLAIAIGIGAAVFSAIDTVLIAPLPYRDPSQLVFIFDRLVNAPGAHGSETSLPNSEDWPKLARSFSSVGSFANWTPTRTDLSVPTTLAGQVVTAGFFDTLGVRPRLGRLFGERDFRSGAPRIVVISESLWRSSFDASPSAVGKSLSLNDVSYRIAGVLPADFVMPRTQAFGGTTRDVYRALAVDATPRNSHYLLTVARLRPGVSLAAAQTDMDRVAALLRSRFPVDDQGLAQHVIPLQVELFGSARFMLTIAFAAFVGTLLIACLNVSNILLGRVAKREPELAIRLSVGASHRRLVAQLLVESAVFAVLGGALGLAFCALLVRLASRLALDIPRLAEVRVSPAVLLFTLVVTTVCAVAIGLVPALTLNGAHISGVLKDAGRAGSNARGKLVRSLTIVLEVALALTLVTGSGLLVRSFLALTSVDVGFDYDGVVATNTVLLPMRRYPTVRSQLAFAHALVTRLKALPDLHSPGLMVSTPLSGENYNAEEFRIIGRPRAPGQPKDVEYNAVTAGGLQSLRLRLLRGRIFDERDDERSEPVAVVTKAFARENFPGGIDPIGQRVVIAFGSNPSWGRKIVGIVDDFKMESLTEQKLPQVIVPLYQDMSMSFQIVARSGANRAGLARAISLVTRSIDRKVSERRVESYAQYVAGQRSSASTAGLLLGFMALVALLLATIGTYGVVAYGVGQRAREFGIRRALGANAWAILSNVLGQALLLAGAGALLGLLLSLAGSKAISNLLYQISPLDPLTFIVAAATLLLAATVAALIPAFRATRADPTAILRHE